MKQNREQIKLAFIGGGLTSAIGPTHYAASLLTNKFKLVAGCFSRSPEHNQATANEWNLDHDAIYLDWKEMIEMEKNHFDLLCILSPTPDHLEVLDFALSQNIPTLCEKSMVSDLQEVDLLESKHNMKEQFLVPVFNYTGYPMLRELKKRVSNGLLGTLKHIHVEMPQESYAKQQTQDILKKSLQNWRMKDGKLPMIFLDLGVHLHNLIDFLTEQVPTEVLCDIANHSNFSEVIDYASLMFKFSSDFKGTMWFSKTALGNRNGLTVRLYGDIKGAIWHQIQPEQLFMFDANGQAEIIDRGSECLTASHARYNRFKVGHPSGFLEAFENFYFDVAEAFYHHQAGKAYKSEYICSYKEAKNGLSFFDAAMASVKNQRWIKVN
jgi:predicted dehydrogenase